MDDLLDKTNLDSAPGPPYRRNRAAHRRVDRDNKYP